MSDLRLRNAILDLRQRGRLDCVWRHRPDLADGDRRRHHTLLSDPDLLTRFRRRFPEHADAHYDEMIRLLEYVWDCPHEGAANVTGYRCARCGRTRAEALG